MVALAPENAVGSLAGSLAGSGPLARPLLSPMLVGANCFEAIMSLNQMHELVCAALG
jgi:hypothetical protein